MIPEIYYITWMNNLGGFEYFPFTARKQYDVDINQSGQTRQNIFPGWPNSYGKNADTIDKQTFRDSKNAVIIRSQHLSLNQLEALTQIKTSTVVQLLISRIDRRTLLIDTDSFKKYDEGDKLFTLQFRALFTDDIPSQRT
jgi:hypothetical protein